MVILKMEIKLEEKYISKFIPENLTIVDIPEKELFCFTLNNKVKKFQ